MADRVPVEEERHRIAFEEYYALGSGRTYAKVAKKLGVSASTIKLWARRFGWKDRIADRERQVARELADQGTEVHLAERDRDLKIVRMAKVRLTKDIAEGRVKGRLPDLELLMRLESYLSGLNDDRHSWIERETDPEKLRRRLRTIMTESGVDAADEHHDDHDTEESSDDD